MPRRQPHPEAGPDEWAAWRIAYERERRQWSQGELARRVTAAGAPMQQQAIWKIENSTPPRKISLTEAMAFCEVFELPDVADLGKPPEDVARDIVAEIKDRRRDWHYAADGLIRQLRHIREYGGADPYIWQQAFIDLRDQLGDLEAEIAEVKAMLDPEAAAVWEMEPTEQPIADSVVTSEIPADPKSARLIVPQPIVAAIVTRGKRVLITARKDGRPPWGFVTGEIEPDEQPADAAMREVKEETGLDVRVAEVIGERDHPATGRHMIYLAARTVRGTLFVGDESELAEVKWASLAEAERRMPTMFEPVRDYLARTIGKGA